MFIWLLCLNYIAIEAGQSLNPSMSFPLRKLFLAVLVLSAALSISIALRNLFWSPVIMALTAMAVAAYLCPAWRLTLLALSPGVVTLLPIVAVLIIQSPPVYYASYNAVKRKLEELPAVTIIDTYQHQDITLEDCSFTLEVPSAPRIWVHFYDGQDWLKLFDKLEGVVLHLPNGTHRNVSVAELEAHGIAVEGVADVEASLHAVLDYCSESERVSDQWLLGRWLHIEYR